MTKIALFAGLLAVAASTSAFAQTATAPATAPAAKPAVTAPAATPAPAKTDDAARTKFRAACSADIAKHCGDVKPVANATPEQVKETRGKMRACLTSHKADLSKDCQAVMNEREAAAAAKKS